MADDSDILSKAVFTTLAEFKTDILFISEICEKYGQKMPKIFETNLDDIFSCKFEKIKQLREEKEGLFKSQDGLVYEFHNLYPKPAVVGNCSGTFTLVNGSPSFSLPVVVLSDTSNEVHNEPSFANAHNGAENGVHRATKLLRKTTVDLLSDSEFANIPAYLKGRITISQLNDVTRKLNRAFETKYKILDLFEKRGCSMKQFSKIERDKLVQFREADCPETSGTAFIVHEDLKLELAPKEVTLLKHVLPSLRHLRRLQELRKGKTVLYLLL